MGPATQDRVLAEQIPLFDAGGEGDGVEKIVVKPAPEDTVVVMKCHILPHAWASIFIYY